MSRTEPIENGTASSEPSSGSRTGSHSIPPPIPRLSPTPSPSFSQPPGLTSGPPPGPPPRPPPSQPPNAPVEEQDNCAICRSILAGALSTTPCGHSFHFQCLATSMTTSSICPICRGNLREDTTPPPTPRVSRMRSAIGTNIRNIHTSSQRNDDHETETVRTGMRGRPARIPRDETRDSEAEVQVDIDIDDFTNDVEIRAEIISGLLHSQCRQGTMSATRDLLSENPDLLYSRGDMGDLLTHEAVLSENDSVLMYIVNDQGLDVNLPNLVRMYPLHYAVMSGCLRMVTILVNRGAYLDCVNDARMTPLMLACDSDDSEITQFLLDRGASVRTQDGCGNYPIHIAARAKSYSCVSKLISAGSTVNLKNHLHDTPLHVSCRLGYHSVSRLLLEEGANPEIDNKFDYSPLDEASSGGNTRMRNLLSRYISS